MSTPIKLTNWDRKTFMNWLASYDSILTDCDGVLWHDNEVIPQVNETLNTLKSLGKRIYFVTNNSLKTRHDLWLKATQMNFLIEESHILTPNVSISEHLQQHLSKEESVYVVGSAAMRQELSNFNIENFGLDADILHGEWLNSLEDIQRVAEGTNVGAVVVGFDEHYSFMKMLKATSFLTSNPNCAFLATNVDAVHRYSNFCIPGTGAILQSLQTCVGKKATVMGKPNPIIVQHLVQGGFINPKRTLMIGDCAKTDVLFGKNCGFQTLLVGSGNYKWAAVQALVENQLTDFIPNYYSESLADLLAFLN